MKVSELFLESGRASDRQFHDRDMAQLRRDYQRWKQLVNMPTQTLKLLFGTTEDSGLSPREAKKLRLPARSPAATAILRMRSMPFSEWGSAELGWMYRQLNFISRLQKSEGPLEKDNKPTKKLATLWAWGHRPKGLTPSKYL